MKTHAAILIAACTLLMGCVGTIPPSPTTTAHASGGAVIVGPTGMMMGMQNTGRMQAEAQKSNAFYAR